MARFTNKDSQLGFDPGAGGAEPPWQMVPLGGARGIKLHDAKGMDIVIGPDGGSTAPDGGLIYSETPISAAHREIWLQGRAVGAYSVRAVDGTGVIRGRMAAAVFSERLVKIAYYFLPGVPRWDTNRLTSLANDILFLQANVRLEVVGVWGNENGESISLPPQIDIEEPAQRTALWDYGQNWAANLLVYFGWTIKTTRKTRTNGVSLGNKILLDGYNRKITEVRSMAHTLAHEIGHFVSNGNGASHDSRPTDLMYDTIGRTLGNAIRRDRVWRVIRPAA